MDESVAAEWEFMLTTARAFDESRADRSRAWSPPIMTALVEAAAMTRLRRLYPFISHNRLSFATNPRFWIRHGMVAPAFIALFTSDSGGDLYGVWSGILGSEDVSLMIETPDAREAASKAEQLLAEWHAARLMRNLPNTP